MSTRLLIHLNERPQLLAGGPAAADASAPAWTCGLLTAGHWHALEWPPRDVPELAETVVVLPAAAVSWHAVTLPKAPKHRVQAAVRSQLEDLLLEDPDDVHVAWDPAARTGETTWVAVTSLAPIRAALQAVEQAGVWVDRVVPSTAPGVARGHFELMSQEASGSDEALQLTWSDEQGVCHWPVHGPLPDAWLTDAQRQSARWTAAPDAVARAEQWLGHAVTPCTAAQRLQEALDAPWQLLQFELQPKAQGWRRVQQLTRQFQAPAWRPARLGLMALVAVQALGWLVSSWQVQHQIHQRERTQAALLQQAFPGAALSSDPRSQMERETRKLRAAAGRPNPDDLEPLLAAAASAWPAGQGPATSIQYDGQRLVLGAATLAPEQVQAMRQQLQTLGLTVTFDDGRLTLTRPTAGAWR